MAYKMMVITSLCACQLNVQLYSFVAIVSFLRAAAFVTFSQHSNCNMLFKRKLNSSSS